MKNKTFDIYITNEVKRATIEISIGKSEKYKYGRKHLFGQFDFEINYKGDRWECLPDFEIDNLKFTDEDDNEIALRPENMKRIETDIVDQLNNMDFEDQINFGVDEDRVRFYDDTPAQPITL
ncbi:hypothetical protein UFOVP611_25 [uncultured Caudovirales phage]|uniref:Uncharacterized protein n=1 Tax=uncultured Caudovirales phage TaxID=2100421 RepID=A0A6J5N3V0_9CAUD|nr:hypothetical protein UFOVP611_25 [uncultured Caudovirales phage]